MAISLLLLGSKRATASRLSLADARYSYGEAPSQRLVSASLAIGIAGGVGAALVAALAAPDIRERLTGPLITRNISVPTPPDTVVMPQPDATATPADSRFTLPRPRVDLPPVNDAPRAEFDTGIILPPGPTIGEGMGGGDVIIRDLPVTPPAPIFREASRDPRFARSFQPAYPPALEREGIVGTARVRVRIGTNGRVISVENLEATDPAFFAATERQALRHWRFRPATRDGMPVESEMVLTVRFEVPPRD